MVARLSEGRFRILRKVYERSLIEVPATGVGSRKSGVDGKTARRQGLSRKKAKS
jgi:hypothetical protein